MTVETRDYDLHNGYRRLGSLRPFLSPSSLSLSLLFLSSLISLCHVPSHSSDTLNYDLVSHPSVLSKVHTANISSSKLSSIASPKSPTVDAPFTTDTRLMHQTPASPTTGEHDRPVTRRSPLNFSSTHSVASTSSRLPSRTSATHAFITP